MTLLYIVAATLIGGLLSVIIAASLTVAVLNRVVKHLVSLSTGVLLGTALLLILPEAFEGQRAPPQALPPAHHRDHSSGGREPSRGP